MLSFNLFDISRQVFMLPELQLFEKIIPATHKVFFLYDVHLHQFSYVSPIIPTLSGLLSVDFSSNPRVLIEAVDPKDQRYVTERFQQLTAGPLAEVIEFTMNIQGAQQRQVVCSASSVEESPGKVAWIGGFLEDVTERKQNESNLYHYTVQKNSLLDILQHDIGGHLNMLHNFAVSLTHQHLQQDVSLLNAFAKSIQELSKTSLELIDELSKKEFRDLASIPLKKDRVEIVSRIRTVFNMFVSSEILIKRQFKLTHSKSEIFAELDEVKFMQVINNIIYNAIKFTNEYGLISIHIMEAGGMLTISVADDGIGIPVALQPFLFGQVPPAGRVGIKGETSQGKGLSIARQIIEAHNGHIRVESMEGEGATFLIEVPLRT